ncbi:MAG TPA: gliding motility-associated C-terminal domain-containing protein [Prolixibacteraceae bacterium]|nr:gliding motility-associated C-terminal domain-containing protein [Prolixibacteraceae bacterium]
MGRIIFVFSFILVIYFIIVSKNASAGHFACKGILDKEQDLSGKDTVISIFQDDFEHADPLGWKLTEDWEVSSSEKISGDFSLKHLVKTASGVSSVFHSVSADWNNYDLEWSFKLKNGKWDPSSSNKFWFYLSADTIQTNLINGWAVGVNISGSTDLLQLWRIRKGKADSLVVQTDLDWNASTLAIIHVKRTTHGFWTLDYQKSGETNPTTFSGTDPTIFVFKNIGLYFKYSVTRSGQLWIDDIAVNRFPGEFFIQKLAVLNSHSLSLTFNKPIDPASIHSGNFRLTDENNQDIPIMEAIQTKGSENSIDISFGKADGVELSLSVSGISDLEGKTMNPENCLFSFTFSPEIGSILINEILFNPFSGGVDFVELVNVSESPVSVHRLKLASRNDTLALKQIYAISLNERFLYPGQFLTCTKDSAIVVAQYFYNDPESFCQMKSFPSLPDDAGTVVLLNDSLEVLDEFSYSAKMHSPFLSDENGISLERISLKEPTTDRENWASAAASVGYATPGLSNSQTTSETEFRDEITAEPKAFSPNGDGYNDQLSIRYVFSKPGYIGNVRIFDVAGRQVNFLVKNESLAQSGSWFWDGISDSRQRLKIGVYIILVEVFDQDGHTKAFKKACTLTDRLD